jgi:hypothetical protein
LLFFFAFFFFAMTLFLGVGDELRQGWFKLRVDRDLDLSLGPCPLTERKHGTERVPAAMKKRK